MSNRTPQRFTHQDVTVTSERTVFKGFYEMRELRIRHARYAGSPIEIKRELMVRPDAVVVLLFDPNLQRVVLIEQYRVGAQRAATPWLIECVAGLIEPGEEPESVARREALEEAGTTIKRVRRLCEYFPSPGGTNEKITLFVGEVDASNAGGIHGLDHEGEDILVHNVTLEQAFDWLNQGVINNAASIIALQWLQLHLSTLKQEWSTA